MHAKNKLIYGPKLPFWKLVWLIGIYNIYLLKIKLCKILNFSILLTFLSILIKGEVLIRYLYIYFLHNPSLQILGEGFQKKSIPLYKYTLSFYDQ
jgi:hypothetical protein